MAADAKTRDRSAGNRRDADLALRARAWDIAAQVELYHRYHNIFRNWVRRWLRFDAWEKECVDFMLATLFEELPKYRPEGSAFCSWAHMVCRSALIKHIHDLSLDRADFPYDEIVADMLPALTEPMDDYVVGRIQEEVANLEAEQRAAVTGHYYEDRTDDEIAAGQGMPRRRVCYRRHQGEQNLRRRLNDVAFTWIRPQTAFFRNSFVMTDAREKIAALLGGEEGDCS
ncbi:sigma-70 family RNA polymerase sigma factor [candidate division WOR-3 bacterium]|uniref:Sigma-70 family RNA polymerase sigma factor n=1 Tax=candidate division WOR-3 bacterium TaxID=2052148 RepID=A0A938BS52_UNCW3|nr:sigma-70 family RNA polymerase sigma factor [candidate division WOR-3 bacterium]